MIDEVRASEDETSEKEGAAPELRPDGLPPAESVRTPEALGALAAETTTAVGQNAQDTIASEEEMISRATEGGTPEQMKEGENLQKRFYKEIAATATAANETIEGIVENRKRRPRAGKDIDNAARVAAAVLESSRPGIEAADSDLDTAREELDKARRVEDVLRGARPGHLEAEMKIIKGDGTHRSVYRNPSGQWFNEEGQKLPGPLGGKLEQTYAEKNFANTEAWREEVSEKEKKARAARAGHEAAQAAVHWEKENARRKEGGFLESAEERAAAEKLRAPEGGLKIPPGLEIEKVAWDEQGNRTVQKYRWNDENRWVDQEGDDMSILGSARINEQLEADLSSGSGFRIVSMPESPASENPQPPETRGPEVSSAPPDVRASSPAYDAWRESRRREEEKRVRSLFEMKRISFSPDAERAFEHLLPGLADMALGQREAVVELPSSVSWNDKLSAEITAAFEKVHVRVIAEQGNDGGTRIRLLSGLAN